MSNNFIRQAILFTPYLRKHYAVCYPEKFYPVSLHIDNVLCK